MIHVIATIELNPGMKDKWLKIFKENVPVVLAEDGCLAYEPNVDFASGIPIQGPLRKNVVTLLEAWESIDHLNAHLATPHMKAYHKQAEGMVKGVTLQVLQPA